MNPNLECCVSGCRVKPNQGLRFYRFPCHNPQISSIWEQRICQSTNNDFDVLNEHVCELHFDYRCKTGNECALEEGSLPTLHLPSFSTLFSTGSAHFKMSTNRIEEHSYTISMDELSYHCRFCLRRGLLYEIETSTYRSKSFLSIIDLPTTVVPDNTQPNACLSCLKSIVVALQLSMAVEHSNKILQQLLQNPKQSQVVPTITFFDIKSELAFCNLILANSLSIKLEIDDNEYYERKWVVTGEQCQKEIYKSVSTKEEYTAELNAEGSSSASEKSDSSFAMENNDGNAEVMVSNNPDDSCAEDRQFDNEQASESISKAVNEPIWQMKSSTPTDGHWSENDSVYICPICDWKTPSLYSLNAHIGKHVPSDKYDTIGLQELETLKTDPERNADGRYQCTECLKAFSRKSHFSRHKIIHKNERPYKCSECPKTFCDVSGFSRHKRIHTNERPFKCPECSKTFIQKSHFSVHKRLHTNERPYECTECPKTFIHKSHFSRHKMKHVNESLYTCAECPKAFSNKSDLSDTR